MSFCVTLGLRSIAAASASKVALLPSGELLSSAFTMEPNENEAADYDGYGMERLCEQQYITQGP